ncbi:GNAT family N-acetyltransferase [Guyparkeria sp. SB14A]|uniref:GNAT family N-acetyltransferase n=1 Tax=Guyparkeria sp. SB14A TaxID=2571147 RepID=UPI0010AC1A2B|nr:GNAT family N-acetyltransferase [Guyparkeria sp. SB14A]TKA88931.1 GNAT family N-acetyltransferase [Guyparkeria sp. SB14A]
MALPTPAPTNRRGLSLDPAATADLPEIARLAEIIWWRCYPPIIGSGQVHYMLGRGYALPALRESLRNGTRFSLLRLAGRSIGFSAWRPAGGGGFLDKLYLHPGFHGTGLGRWLIDATCREMARDGVDRACLRVNRHNRPAIRAYERAGFVITGTDCQPIGGGYVMDDYLMSRTGILGLLLD